MGRKEKAWAYVKGLEVGAMSTHEIVAWADSIIEVDVEPSIEFIELSMIKSRGDAIVWLNVIAFEASIQESACHLFKLYYDALLSGKCTYEDVAKHGYFVASDEDEIGEFGELFGYWDDLDLAIYGSYGDVDEIKSKMLVFFEENKA